jgi:hypothetical protein
MRVSSGRSQDIQWRIVNVLSVQKLGKQRDNGGMLWKCWNNDGIMRR